MFCLQVLILFSFIFMAVCQIKSWNDILTRLFPMLHFYTSRKHQETLRSSDVFRKFRSSHQRCFVKKGVPKNFAKFTEFSEISKNTFFIEHLWTTASRSYKNVTLRRYRLKQMMYLQFFCFVFLLRKMLDKIYESKLDCHIFQNCCF